jgi:DNA-binding IscR family transcriptional regulator
MQLNVVTILAIEIFQELETAVGRRHLDDLADALDVTSAYAGKVLAALSNAGLLSGERGVGGGYQRIKSARDIPLRDLLAAMEGLLPPSAADTPVMKKIRSQVRDRAFVGVSVADCFSQNVTTRPLEDTSDMMDAKGVAAALGVTKAGVSYLVQKGKLPAPQIVNRKQVWPRAVVKRLAAGRKNR